MYIDESGMTYLKEFDGSDTLDGLIHTATSKKMEEAAKKLQSLSSEKLFQTLSESHAKKRRIAFWLTNQEFTIRGIPPIFRNLPPVDKDNHTLMADLFWVDLEWLGATHPAHVPLFKRWGDIFKKKSFPHRTAKYIFDSLKPEMWKIVKGLSLPEDWQVELHFIKQARLHNEFERLMRLRPIILNQLRTAHYSRGLKMLSDDVKMTIQRREDIWLCANMANGKPQRTAALYKFMTGQAITRQLAAKIISQVHRDIPEAFAKTWTAS